MKNKKGEERQYWLWVTGPEYYLEEDGSEREILDPSCEVDPVEWTCHRDTRGGDLVFLWRTAPRCDIGYLLQAESDAYWIGNKDVYRGTGWDYGCECRPLYKFQQPVTIQDLHEDVTCMGGEHTGQIFGVAFIACRPGTGQN